MIKSNKIFSTLTIALSLAAIVGCSSGVKQADIPNTANPQEEIVKFDTLLTEAVAKNVDVLAPSEYKDAVKMRDEAKEDMASNEKQEEILNDIRTGRGHLNKAWSVSANREAKAPGLFEARQAALKAGAATHASVKEDLKDLDSDVSGKADDLSSMSSDKLAKLQERYVEIERRSVIENQLGNAQAMLNGAEKSGATKKAPRTFKSAEVAMKNAQSVISTNVRNPMGFQKAVYDANAATTLLNDVMTTIKQNKNLSEPSALKMVSQNRQIKNLKTDLSTSNTENAATEAAMQEKNQQLSTDLAQTNQNLNAAQATVDIQSALEEARKQFKTDEAEAYQQGDSLVIRMKNINFASGRADLPASSLASLAKVSEVAKSLQASGIKIEGHTDSTGTESQNKSISEKRADAVATYFKTNGFENIDVQSAGYGFQKPIATNKSKEGRAQNRRVDIVITPTGATKSTVE